MLLETLGASLLGNLLKGKRAIELAKKKLEQVKIFNAAPFFN